MPRPPRRAFAAVILLAAACNRDEDQHHGAPPPPPPTAKPAACAGGGGKIADAASAPFFPQGSPSLGGFCLDPNGGDKTFGEGASLPIDHICDLFDGEYLTLSRSISMPKSTVTQGERSESASVSASGKRPSAK